jgi:4'-phosphopantetheinyl transferase
VDIYWLEQNESDVPFGDQWLSGSERARLAGFQIPKRRADWRLGRWTAKCALTRYWNLPRNLERLAAVELRPAPSGAPQVFLHGRPELVTLSLSHSSGTGLCAIAPGDAAVGCDLEEVEPRSARFLSDYFTGNEQNLVAHTPPNMRDQVLTVLWSAKESALKALCCGLRMDTRSVSAVPARAPQALGGEWRRVSAAHIDGRTFHGWWRESHNLAYSVVADPPPLRLVSLQPAVAHALVSTPPCA